VYLQFKNKGIAINFTQFKRQVTKLVINEKILTESDNKIMNKPSIPVYVNVFSANQWVLFAKAVD